MRREDLKSCTLYKSKPFEYQTKGTMYKQARSQEFLSAGEVSIN